MRRELRVVRFVLLLMLRQRGDRVDEKIPSE